MEFYLLDRSSQREWRIPLQTTQRYPGYVVVNCKVCGTTGIVPQSKSGLMPVEIAIQGVGLLQDIEQAGTTLLASKKMQDLVTRHGLSGMDFYAPVGYQIVTKKKGAEK